MKARSLKKRIGRATLMDWSGLFVATEFVMSYGNADVFMLNRNGFTTEYEIKVSRADLMGEIKAIRNFLFGGNEKNPRKSEKHRIFLHGRETKNVPNSFYFVVPEKLRKVAIEGVAGTKYGVIVVSEKDRPWGLYCCFEFAVRAKKIHNEKCDENLKYQLARRCCVENFFKNAK